MKNRFRYGIAAACGLFFLLALTACGQGNRNGDAQVDISADPMPLSGGLAETPEEPEADAADGGSDDSAGANVTDAAPADLTMESDMGVSVNGQWFPIWQDAEGLLQALGGGYELYSAPSCVFEGEDKEFAYDDYFVYTNPDGDRDIWYSIYLMTDALSTARGIKVGSTLDEVFAAYGGRYYWEGEDILSYSISGVEGDIDSPCIQFFITGGTVTAIDIYYPTNVT